MESEMMNLVSVVIIVSLCLTYCYLISSKVPKGLIRLFFFLPVISIFLLLPRLHSTVLFQLYTGLFIAWLANFKLLLVALGQDDPLSTDLLSFIMVTSLPIKLKTKFATKRNPVPTDNLHSPLMLVINAILWFSVVLLYVNKPYILPTNQKVLQLLYTSRMILNEQVIFTLVGWAAMILLKCEIEAQFNNPHLSTSLQNFWGRRWNLMSSSILKSTVYLPMRSKFSTIVGKRWAVYPAVLTTFAISGLMHETLYFYATHQWPSWEVTWFFVINGVWVAIEIELKKRALENGWNLHEMISRLLTLGFLVATGTWWLCTELVKSGTDSREIQEYASLVHNVKNILLI